jgi:hypothetical protein
VVLHPHYFYYSVWEKQRLQPPINKPDAREGKVEIDGDGGSLTSLISLTGGVA